jgi:hypothetical protein
MAYPLDVAAQNAGLKAWFGDGRAASVPSSWEVALFNGHPLTGGTELGAAGGYARLVVANTTANFPDPVSGVVRSVDLLWSAPTAAWSDVATHYLLIDHADSTSRWYVGALGQSIDYTGGAGPAFKTRVEVPWNQEGA